MVNKKKYIYISCGFILVLLATIVYFSYFSQPSSFLTEEMLIEEINKTFPKANANQILEVFDVSEKHKYVPFITGEDDYGKSFWVWDKYKWRLAYIDTKGRPYIWKINKNDPASYHLVWNIHPDDQVKKGDFYMIRDRGYRTTEGQNKVYYPRVQVQRTISFEENAYGVLKIPHEWATYVQSIKDTQLAQQSKFDAFFNEFSVEQQIYFSWMPLNEASELTFPKRSVNGISYSNGDIDVDFVMPIDEMDIERGHER
ncbi:hypothetical protein CIB95_15585 [Lottiidibacillus patelloidae]|uniref:Uncharacterized protein n=1 Tax=Lottiidibacillus patelloidae TaxID=2670334 RepID=A0A263BPW2_9BACI|nr:hypothetical protein [Lottiidibacillus patelloidae]OZM55783.1 hypothetical protein CIB95_15585 [Lottiidibacillus patelloidae]